MFYFAMASMVILIAILGFGFYYETYLKPIDCKSYGLDTCPKRCALCPSCKTCNSLACQDVKTCKDMGLYEPWLEQVRSDKPVADPLKQIKDLYEPALKKIDGYDHLEIVGCDNSLCVRIYLKSDSEALKAKMPKTIDNMRVIFETVWPTDSPANGNQPSTGCGIENCHGMDITCGPNVPDVCTETYMLGDGCRIYAKCAIVSGKCQQLPIKEFDDCRACVKKCETDFASDNTKMFTCEADCRANPSK